MFGIFRRNKKEETAKSETTDDIKLEEVTDKIEEEAIESQEKLEIKSEPIIEQIDLIEEEPENIEEKKVFLTCIRKNSK